MLKKVSIIKLFLGFMILVILLFGFYLCITEINIKQLDGSLITANNNIEIYTMHNGSKLSLNNIASKGEYISEAVFNYDRSKVIALIENGVYATRTKVVEVDLSTRNKNIIFTGENKDEDIRTIQYVPNSNSVSFVSSRDNFCIYDMKSKSREMFDIRPVEYSWANDGKYFLYAEYKRYSKDNYSWNEASIQGYNIDTKTHKLFSGLVYNAPVCQDSIFNFLS